MLIALSADAAPFYFYCFCFSARLAFDASVAIFGRISPLLLIAICLFQIVNIIRCRRYLPLRSALEMIFIIKYDGLILPRRFRLLNTLL